MSKMCWCALLFLASCKSAFFDPTTQSMAVAVGDLVGAYLLRAGDAWADKELADDDTEWKDVVADLYVLLRQKKNFSDSECQIIDRNVTKSLQELKIVAKG